MSKIDNCTYWSAGSPTNTAVPPRRRDPKACSNAFGETATQIATSAPPNFLNSSIGLAFDASIVYVAPSSLARFSFSSNRSTATTVAPAIAAYCPAKWPRPPTPKIATRSADPAPETLTALYVVTPAHVSGPAAKGSTPFVLYRQIWRSLWRIRHNHHLPNNLSLPVAHTESPQPETQ